MEFGEAADGGQVVGRPPEHLLQLVARFLVVALIEERPAERDSCGQLIGELLQPFAAEGDCPIEVAGPAEALCDSAEGRCVFCRSLSAPIQADARHDAPGAAELGGGGGDGDGPAGDVKMAGIIHNFQRDSKAAHDGELMVRNRVAGRDDG